MYIRLSEKIYSWGDIGDLDLNIKILRTGKGANRYYVYTTSNRNFILQIGAYNSLKYEKDEPVILGIAESKEYALLIVRHIIAETNNAEGTWL